MLYKRIKVQKNKPCNYKEIAMHINECKQTYSQVNKIAKWMKAQILTNVALMR